MSAWLLATHGPLPGWLWVVLGLLAAGIGFTVTTIIVTTHRKDPS